VLTFYGVFVGACCRPRYCGFWKVLCASAWANGRAAVFHTVTSLLCFADRLPPIGRLLLILIICTGVIRSRAPISFRRFVWKQTVFALSTVKSKCKSTCASVSFLHSVFHLDMARKPSILRWLNRFPLKYYMLAYLKYCTPKLYIFVCLVYVL